MGKGTRTRTKKIVKDQPGADASFNPDFLSAGAVLDHIALSRPVTRIWARLARQEVRNDALLWVYPMASPDGCVSPNPIQVPTAELNEQGPFKRHFCLVPGDEDFILYLGRDDEG